MNFIREKLNLKFDFGTGFIVFLLILNLLPILAPIFQSWGWAWASKPIYFVYSFMCHQIHWRSLHIVDHQCAWCARDMAIWGGVLVAAIMVKAFRLRGLKLYQILPFMIPIGLDGGIQTIANLMAFTSDQPLYISTNLMRAITGSIFGVGLGLTVLPMAINAQIAALNPAQLKKLPLPNLKHIFGAVAVVLIGYVLFVGAWALTSSEYLPSNLLDSANKFPENPSSEIVRRENAVCPGYIAVSDVNTQGFPDPVQFDCFWGE